MSMENILKITETDISEANFFACKFANKEIKTRAFVNALGSKLAMNYLAQVGINVENIYNLHYVRKILEEFDIADIILSNAHIDVRVIYNENEIFIPKSHFDFNIVPDIYIVMKVDKGFESVEILGFFEPKLINKENQNEDYYFIEKERLSNLSDLPDFIGLCDRNTMDQINDEEINDIRNLMFDMLDNDISESDKKYLLQKLISSAQLRDSFIELENFETLSYSAINNPEIVPQVEQKSETQEEVINFEQDENLSSDEIGNQDDIPPQEDNNIEFTENSNEEEKAVIDEFSDENIDLQNSDTDEINIIDDSENINSSDKNNSDDESLNIADGILNTAAGLAGTMAAGALTAGSMEISGAEVVGDITNSAGEAAGEIINNAIDGAENAIQDIISLDSSDENVIPKQSEQTSIFDETINLDNIEQNNEIARFDENITDTDSDDTFDIIENDTENEFEALDNFDRQEDKVETEFAQDDLINFEELASDNHENTISFDEISPEIDINNSDVTSDDNVSDNTVSEDSFILTENTEPSNTEDDFDAEPEAYETVDTIEHSIDDQKDYVNEIEDDIDEEFQFDNLNESEFNDYSEDDDSIFENINVDEYSTKTSSGFGKNLLNSLSENEDDDIIIDEVPDITNEYAPETEQNSDEILDEIEELFDTSEDIVDDENADNNQITDSSTENNDNTEIEDTNNESLELDHFENNIEENNFESLPENSNLPEQVLEETSPEPEFINDGTDTVSADENENNFHSESIDTVDQDNDENSDITENDSSELTDEEHADNDVIDLSDDQVPEDNDIIALSDDQAPEDEISDTEIDNYEEEFQTQDEYEQIEDIDDLDEKNEINSEIELLSEEENEEDITYPDEAENDSDEDNIQTINEQNEYDNIEPQTDIEYSDIINVDDTDIPISPVDDEEEEEEEEEEDYADILDDNSISETSQSDDISFESTDDIQETIDIPEVNNSDLFNIEDEAQQTEEVAESQEFIDPDSLSEDNVHLEFTQNENEIEGSQDFIDTESNSDAEDNNVELTNESDSELVTFDDSNIEQDTSENVNDHLNDVPDDILEDVIELPNDEPVPSEDEVPEEIKYVDVDNFDNDLEETYIPESPIDYSEDEPIEEAVFTPDDGVNNAMLPKENPKEEDPVSESTSESIGMLFNEDGSGNITDEFEDEEIFEDSQNKTPGAALNLSNNGNLITNRNVILAAVVFLVVLGASGMGLLVKSKLSSKAPSDVPPSSIVDNELPRGQEEDFNNDISSNIPDINEAKENAKMQPSQQQPKVVGSGNPVGTALSVKNIVWQVPDYLSYSDLMKNYLRTAGKSIKLSLSSDLLLSTEYAYSDRVKVAMKISEEGKVVQSAIVNSSGSTQIDKIVLQSVISTLNVVKPPSKALKNPDFNLTITIYF